MRDGEPWFVAADVCRCLGIGETHVAMRRLHADDKSVFKAGLPGKPPALVNESGLYDLILQSRKPEARTFKRWVTSEVLPTIRKTGAYVTPQVVAKMQANEERQRA
jgi:prophage antirepressor-like protein